MTDLYDDPTTLPASVAIPLASDKPARVSHLSPSGNKKGNDWVAAFCKIAGAVSA
jgi:hypothetical protein